MMKKHFMQTSALQRGTAVFAVALVTSFTGMAGEATSATGHADPAIAEAIERIGDLHRKGAISGPDGEAAFDYYMNLSSGNGRVLAAIPPENLIEISTRNLRPDGPKAAKYYQIAGKLGNADAFLRLGELYFDGELVAPDPDKAFDYFQQAAALGSDTASVNIGLMMIRGAGTPRNVSGGMALLDTASERGNTQALLALGNIYRTGDADGIPPDAQRSFGFYKRAADSGNAFASIIVARMLIDGEGIPASPEKGYDIARNLADAGEPGAFLLMGELLVSGIPGVLPPDATKAYEYYKKASETGSGTARTQVALMQVHGRGTDQNVNEGLQILQALADAGDPSALRELGQLYEDGVTNALAADPGKAFSFYQSAAAKGDLGSQLKVAKMLIAGSGTNADVKAGVLILEELAEKKTSDAYLLLAEYYSGAIDGPQSMDLEKAFQHYRKAAEAGSTTGQIQAALMMLRGEGTPLNQTAGLGLLQKAADDGNPEALIALGNAYASGEAGAINAEGAIAAYEAAAAQGVPRANILLGDLFSTGQIVPADGEMAVFYYERAAGIEPEATQEAATGVNPL